MRCYLLAQLTIHDQERYGRYVRAFAATLEPFDARLLAADDNPDVLEGEWALDKVVLVEFRDRLEADRWASSPAYAAIVDDRLASTTATVLALDGVATTPPPAAHTAP